MDEFERRERNFEKQFEIEQALEFRAHARRARLIGEWAASRMGLSAAGAKALIADLLSAELAHGDENDVYACVRETFDRVGLPVSDHAIHQMMRETLVDARVQVRIEA